MSGPSLDLLLVTWNFPPKTGGMENLMFNLHDHLRREIRMAVIAPFSSTGERDPEVFRAPLPGFPFFCVYALTRGLHLSFSGKPRVLMGGSLVMTPLLFILKRLFPARSVAYAHGLDIIYRNPFYQVLLKKFLPSLDGVICNSVNTQRLLRGRFPRTNSHVIPPGVDCERYNRPAKRCVSGKYLLFVGRLAERKGLVPFIAGCFAPIAEEFKDLSLIIVGSDPKDAMAHRTGYREKIVAGLRETGLEDRVSLKGSVSEEILVSLYQHCESLVLPVIPAEGDVEGFGMVAIEAAAAGKPVVAFDEGGISDAVAHGVTGLIVPPADYEAMRDALRSILCHEVSFPFLRQYTGEKYAWPALIDKFGRYLFSKDDESS